MLSRQVMPGGQNKWWLCRRAGMRPRAAGEACVLGRVRRQISMDPGHFEILMLRTFVICRACVGIWRPSRSTSSARSLSFQAPFKRRWRILSAGRRTDGPSTGGHPGVHPSLSPPHTRNPRAYTTEIKDMLAKHRQRTWKGAYTTLLDKRSTKSGQVGRMRRIPGRETCGQISTKIVFAQFLMSSTMYSALMLCSARNARSPLRAAASTSTACRTMSSGGRPRGWSARSIGSMALARRATSSQGWPNYKALRFTRETDGRPP